MKIGVIGGSGLDAIDGLEAVREERLETPFGAPSDSLICGRLGGQEIVFLPRHGRGHRLLPGELNHRANIYALKSVGVERIVSFSAVGSFREEMAPRDFVLVDQFVDRTKSTAQHTFFGDGLVAHIGFAQPTCPALRTLLHRVATAELAGSAAVHDGGTYLNMEGPAFSTLAESRLYRTWGMDVIGMTNLAEAKLSREAEICYLTVAMVTDYDCWHEVHETVSVEMIIQTLTHNAQTARNVIRAMLPALAAEVPPCNCRSALQTAIITAADAVPRATYEKLELLVGKYLQPPA